MLEMFSNDSPNLPILLPFFSHPSFALVSPYINSLEPLDSSLLTSQRGLREVVNDLSYMVDSMCVIIYNQLLYTSLSRLSSSATV